MTRGGERRAGRPLALTVAGVAAVVVVAFAGACSGGAPKPRQSVDRPRPGAAGVGDPYLPKAGNGGIDVRHYGLALRYDSGRIDATATLRMTATQALSRFDLDLQGLRVTGVRVNGTPARHSLGGGELRITPARPIANGAAFTTEVAYGGTPKPLNENGLGSSGWIPTSDGAFVAGEPDGSRTWFPSNDHPSDKATYDVAVTVPKGRTALSNGILDSTRRAGGHTTFTWHEKHPMATYLATATIGRFHLRRGKTAAGIPVLAAADSKDDGGLTRLYTDTAKITDAWAKEFGPYPFAATGGVTDIVHGADYALENQTKPLYGMPATAPVIAHELAHQWFGDSVTPRTWRDIWLNEGFATYAEWLWHQRSGGPPVDSAFDTAYATPAGDELWQVPPGDPGLTHLFGVSVYNRGAMTLVALREKIGATAFRRLLRTWARQHRYGNATTGDFTRLAAKVAGRDLTRFFHAWLYQRGKPRSW